MILTPWINVRLGAIILVWCESRTAYVTPFLGAATLSRQDPKSKPTSPKRSPRPICTVAKPFARAST